jgi:uncharacterized protein YlxW (UPF0749 family)
MNQYEMVAVIVVVVMVTSMIRSIFGLRRPRKGERPPVAEDAEARRLREEVKQLKERLAVIERITVEKENSLEREIERLRDH